MLSVDSREDSSPGAKIKAMWQWCISSGTGTHGGPPNPTSRLESSSIAEAKGLLATENEVVGTQSWNWLGEERPQLPATWSISLCTEPTADHCENFILSCLWQAHETRFY